MSILFFDHLVVIKGLDKKIKEMSSSNDEMQEIWRLVEELIHHKVFECCLDNLPKKHHSEFLEMFHKSPHDKNILKYLDSKTKKDIKKIITGEIKELSKELLFLDSHKV